MQWSGTFPAASERRSPRITSPFQTSSMDSFDGEAMGCFR
jgi:hypothetical protein